MKYIYLFKINIVLIFGLLILISCEKEPPEIEFISIKSAPVKLEYFDREILNISGSEITLNYNNGETEDIDFSEYGSKGIVCSPAHGMRVTFPLSQFNILHAISGKSVNQSIIVKEIKVVGLEIKSLSTKMDFYSGDFLNLNGLVITIEMNNGDMEDIDIKDFSERGIICSPENGTKLSTSVDVTIKHQKSGVKNNFLVNVEKLKDFEKNEYEVVRIGDQLWMAENLRSTIYSDGMELVLKTSVSEWANLNETIKAYCYNSGSPGDDIRYGYLYNWAAASNGQNATVENSQIVQGVCPEGWHLPDNSEFLSLIDYLGGEEFAGGKLKETGTENWQDPNVGATNESGFTALPVGYRSTDGVVYSKGTGCYFWSKSISCEPCGPNNYWLRNEYTNFYYGGSTDTNAGISVRCIED